MNTLSENLKRLRKERKLKQSQVADIVGVNSSVISAYENGLRQPSYGVLIKLANLYRVSTDYLLGLKDKKTIDISNLSEREAMLIRELVSELSNRAAEKVKTGSADL